MKNLALPLALALLLTGCINTSKSNVPLKVIDKAPEFQIRNVRGGDPLTSKDFKGKVVVVDFWATWCVPCKAEIPNYNKLREKMKGKDVEFLGVTFESGSTIEGVQPYLEELGIEYPVGMGSDAIDVGFGGHRGYPTTYLVGKDWKVYRQMFGSSGKKMTMLEKDINDLLARSASD